MSQYVKKTPLLLLAVFCLLPTIQIAVSVHWQWQTAISYPIFKLLMICVPIVVWLASGYTGRQIGDLIGLKRTNMLPGLAVGLIMAGAILGIYYGLTRSILDPIGAQSKARGLGVLDHYWMMGLLISFAHSLFEEYYWRGFILSQLASRISRSLPLSLTAGVVFGIHHIFIILVLFEWHAVALCVLGTMFGGFVWARMRLAGYSIWDCYLSHVMVDLAIMWAGYDLLLKAQ